jgi:activator of HSP90 ATPase
MASSVPLNMRKGDVICLTDLAQNNKTAKETSRKVRP